MSGKESQILDAAANCRILVVGDVMLDQYVWGNADRISPEAPVTILDVQDADVRLGGAASVASQLRELGCAVDLCGVVGQDSSSVTFRRLLRERSVGENGLVVDTSRPTTTKRRYLARAARRHSCQVLRVDEECRDPLVARLQEKLLTQVERTICDADAVLIADHDKGVIGTELLREIRALTGDTGIPLIVDPAMNVDFRRYADVDVLLPNRHEAASAVNIAINSVGDASKVAKRLMQQVNARCVFLTLDRDGMICATPSSIEHHVARPIDIYDITGAGDTVAAVVALGWSVRANVAAIATLANTAAGLQVGKVGASTISCAEIRSQLTERLVFSSDKKVVERTELQAVLHSYRRQGHSIVFTNGCFDLFHLGHLRCLQEASQLGDVLVVAINSDESVRRLKGDCRPLVQQSERAAILAALECVDHVVVYEENTPCDLLREIRPDVLVKGGTYDTGAVVGVDIVERLGGRVHVTSKVSQVSTTSRVTALTARMLHRPDQLPQSCG